MATDQHLVKFFRSDGWGKLDWADTEKEVIERDGRTYKRRWVSKAMHTYDLTPGEYEYHEVT
jgi:hypothetical protein